MNSQEFKETAEDNSYFTLVTVFAVALLWATLGLL